MGVPLFLSSISESAFVGPRYGDGNLGCVTVLACARCADIVANEFVAGLA